MEMTGHGQVVFQTTEAATGNELVPNSVKVPKADNIFQLHKRITAPMLLVEQRLIG